MKSLFLNILFICGSWYYTDLDSHNGFNSVIAPIGLFLALIWLGFWFVLVAGLSGRADDRDRFGHHSSSDFGDWGDD